MIQEHNFPDETWEIFIKTKNLTKRTFALLQTLSFAKKTPLNNECIPLQKYMINELESEINSISDEIMSLYSNLKYNIIEKNESQEIEENTYSGPIAKEQIPLLQTDRDGRETEEYFENEIYKDPVQEQKNNTLFLGGYQRPFIWECDDYNCVISDMFGEAITVKSDMSKIHKSIIAPLLDKICDILNGKEVDIEAFPKMKASFQYEPEHPYIYTEKYRLILKVNSVTLIFIKRPGPEDNLSDKLATYLQEYITDEKTRNFLALLKQADIPQQDYMMTIKRFNENTKPYYVPSESTFYIKDEAAVIYYTLSLERIIRENNTGQESKKTELTIESIKEMLEEFHSMEIRKQADDANRIEMAQRLTDTFLPEKDTDMEQGIADMLYIKDPINVDDSISQTILISKEKYEKWAKEHELKENDIEVPATNWDNEQYLISEYKQAEQIDKETIKVKTGQWYEKK